MNATKWIKWIIPTAMMFAACSENATQNNAEVQEGSKMLQGVTASMFDLPSSIANDNSTVALQKKNASLAKSVAINDESSQEASALGFYTGVPAIIHLSEAIKDSVRVLIEKLAAEDLPELYEGNWGEYNVKLVSVDSLGTDEEGKLFRLTMKKDGEVVLHLQYRKNDRNQYRGSCYFHSQDADSSKVLLRFNTFNEGALGKRMTLWITRPASTLENKNDPSVFRFRAVQKPDGRVILSGLTYHPEFESDDFWLDGPKVYGFRAVSDAEKDMTVLRVAFADVNQVGENFFRDHALDKEVLGRATEIWKEAMIKNDTIAKAVVYSLDAKIPLSEIVRSPAEIIKVWAHTPSKPVEEFSVEDMEAYLVINREDILNGTDEGMKILYFHAKVEQPIFLASGAKIVGYEGNLAIEFSLTSADLDNASVDTEIPSDLDATDITKEDAETEDAVEDL